MAASWIFAPALYAILAACLLASWGWGRAAVRLAALSRRPKTPVEPAGGLPPGLPAALAIAGGAGAASVLFQGFAAAGVFGRGIVLAWLAGGLLWAVGTLTPALRRRRVESHGSTAGWQRSEQLAVGLALLAVLPTLFAPLRPPIGWDELMYHLPHAREWARTGQLTVHNWLRYPWFPYNVELLFSAALLFGNDVLPHLFHAAAGWLVAWIVFALGAFHANRVVGALAACIWMLLSQGQYGQADVDMVVTLWLVSGCVAFWQAWQRRSAAWWAVAACFTGLAVGAKYQALGLLPLLGVAFLWRERRPAVWLAAGVAFAVPCAYWYLRNAVLTGDPVAPFGGRVFGFGDWNLGDFRLQFDDLRSKAGVPHVLVWPAPLAFLAVAVRRQPAWIAAGVAALFQVLVWALSSRYPRYLMPAYPLLALLSAQALYTDFQAGVARWRPGARWTRAGHGAVVGVLLLSCLASLAMAYQRARLAAWTPAARERVLAARIPGIRVMAYLREKPVAKLYQMGLEGTVYYLPAPVWGDFFGPWRYRDYALPPPALRTKLLGEGFDALVVQRGRGFPIAAAPGFDQYFALLAEDGPVALYRVRPEPLP